MAVRSAMPWPLRWAVAAIMLGFCGAIALWAFEFGRDIAGLEEGGQAQIQQLRAQIVALKVEMDTAREQRDQAQSIANTAGTLVAAEKASSEQVNSQVKQLEAENRRLRDDLGFFEKLIPADSTACKRKVSTMAKFDGKCWSSKAKKMRLSWSEG